MKKKKILLVSAVFLLLVMNVLIIMHKGTPDGFYKMTVGIEADQDQNIQVYFTGEGDLSEENSQIYPVKADERTELTFSLPEWTKTVRLDLGSVPGNFVVDQCQFGYKKTVVRADDLLTGTADNTQQISGIKAADGKAEIKTEGPDPFVWLEFPEEELYQALAKDHRIKTTVINVLMLLFLDGGAAFAVWKRKKILTLPVELYQNRSLIWGLAKNDFKTKYAGSYLGIVWAFVQPIVTIMVYWFVFSVGLKAGDMSDYPFVLYLVSGIIPWFFFQDALNGGTNSLIEYNYLVKKVVFKISILPIVKIISAFFVHIFFVAFALILCSCYGYLPGLHTLQILYYSACTFILTLGLVYVTSAIVIFFRDLTQIISIFLQVGVWLTPIMWDLQILSNHPVLMKLFKLNPMYYIVSGYRDAMLGKVWLWEHWGWTLYFWVVAAALFVVGAVIFKRLKPHFADVL